MILPGSVRRGVAANIKEFLAKGQRLPVDVQPEMLICLGGNGLTAKPVFWTSKGLVFVPLANDVNYLWNGKAFEKTVTPLEETE